MPHVWKHEDNLVTGMEDLLDFLDKCLFVTDL